MTAFRKYNSRSAKLTGEQVVEIRRLYHEERWSQSRLARQFNMSGVQIGRIVRGESHQALPGGANPNPGPIEFDSAPVVEVSPELKARLAIELAADMAASQAGAAASPLDSLPPALAAKAAFYTSGAKPPVEDNQETHHATDTQRDPAPAGRADPSDPHGGAAEPPDRHQHSGPVGTGSPSEAEDQPLGAQSDEPG